MSLRTISTNSNEPFLHSKGIIAADYTLKAILQPPHTMRRWDVVLAATPNQVLSGQRLAYSTSTIEIDVMALMQCSSLLSTSTLMGHFYTLKAILQPPHTIRRWDVVLADTSVSSLQSSTKAHCETRGDEAWTSRHNCFISFVASWSIVSPVANSTIDTRPPTPPIRINGKCLFSYWHELAWVHSPSNNCPVATREIMAAMIVTITVAIAASMIRYALFILWIGPCPRSCRSCCITGDDDGSISYVHFASTFFSGKYDCIPISGMRIVVVDGSLVDGLLLLLIVFCCCCCCDVCGNVTPCSRSSLCEIPPFLLPPPPSEIFVMILLSILCLLCFRAICLCRVVVLLLWQYHTTDGRGCFHLSRIERVWKCEKTFFLHNKKMSWGIVTVTINKTATDDFIPTIRRIDHIYFLLPLSISSVFYSFIEMIKYERVCPYTIQCFALSLKWCCHFICFNLYVISRSDANVCKVQSCHPDVEFCPTECARACFA